MICGFIGKMGCFAKDTLVQTIDGFKSIQEVDTVLSYDFKGNIISVPCGVVETRKVPYQITFSDGSSVVCSKEHPFYTSQGWVKTKDLHIGQIAVSFQEMRSERREEPFVSAWQICRSEKEQRRILIDSETQSQVGVLLMQSQEHEKKFRLSCSSQGLQQHEQLSKQFGCFVPTVSRQSPLLNKFISKITKLNNKDIVMYDLIVPNTNNFLLANGVLTHNSGKTLSMVRETVKYYAKGYEVYSNFHLEIPYTPLDFDTLFHMAENQESLGNVIILLDEVHIMLDSRSSMKKSSKVVSFWLNQTRKMKVKLFYTTQHLHQVDKRLRSGTDFFCFCEGIKYLRNNKEYFIVVNQITDGDRYREENFLGNRFFKYYDTNEVIKFMSEATTSGHGEKTVDGDGSFVPDFTSTHSEVVTNDAQKEALIKQWQQSIDNKELEDDADGIPSFLGVDKDVEQFKY